MSSVLLTLELIWQVMMKKAKAIQSHLRRKGKGLNFKVQLRSILLAREEDKAFQPVIDTPVIKSKFLINSCNP